jgi:hypothetical protein
MTSIRIGRWAALVFCLPLAGALAQPNTDTNVVEERVTVENGAVEVCGEGDGLQPCLDANGQTYAQEAKGADVTTESDAELAAGAARVRAETPEELNKTIKEMEEGYNPDDRATMGLPQ